MRVFHCKNCDHHMRLGGTRCGRCGELKPVYQMPVTYGFLTFGAVSVGAYLSMQNMDVSTSLDTNETVKEAKVLEPSALGEAQQKDGLFINQPASATRP